MLWFYQCLYFYLLRSCCVSVALTVMLKCLSPYQTLCPRTKTEGIKVKSRLTQFGCTLKVEVYRAVEGLVQRGKSPRGLHKEYEDSFTFPLESEILAN